MEVLVEYEYVGVEEDELTIRPGDVITDVKIISDGWMEGYLDGRSGAFPDNFVKEIKKEEKVKGKDSPVPPAASHKKQGSHVEELAKKIGTQGIKMGPPPSNSKVVKRDQTKRLYRAKVTFSYTPENEDELRLEVGDVVEVLQKAEEGWWEGTVHGKVGMFPSNFVEVVPEENAPEEKAAPIEAVRGKKLIGGQGFGNIFGNGPIKLRPTADTKPTPVTADRVEPDTRSSPLAKEPEKTGSLKRTPPALPPKDVTEGKKSSSAEALSPIQDWPSFTSPDRFSHTYFSEPQLDSIPEIQPGGVATGVYESGISHTLSPSVYSCDEQPSCLHGDDVDHTSLDSEGCCYLDPTSSDSLVVETTDCISPSQVSPYESELASPLAIVILEKHKMGLDGRKSAASGFSSGSDVPLDNSAISKTRATPPPKMTFRKRRAMGTPKNQLDELSGSPSATPMSAPSKSKPPVKRPRRFLSATGIGWSQTNTGKESITSAKTVLEKSRVSDIYYSVDGQLSTESHARTLWGYNEKGEFYLGPQMMSEKVYKKVSFTPKDSLNEPEGKDVFLIDDIDYFTVRKNSHKTKPIDGQKITDSIDLNKEKLKSGRWCKPDEMLKESTDKLEVAASQNQSKPSQQRRSIGHFVRNTIETAFTTLLSSSPRRSSKLSHLEKTLDNADTPGQEPTMAAEGEVAVEQDQIVDEIPKEMPLDIVSATALPTTDIITHKYSTIDPHVFRDRFSSSNKEEPSEIESMSSPSARVQRKKSFLQSQFSRWSKYRNQKKVIPIVGDEKTIDSVVSSETPNFREEIMDGMTYMRMPDIEPTYLESLKELGRLSPSVRRLSQRYSLFQKGMSPTRSTEYLERNSLYSVESLRTSSLPKLDVDLESSSYPPKPYSLFLAQPSSSKLEEKVAEKTTPEISASASYSNDIDQFKPKRAFSLRRSIGTWPRKIRGIKSNDSSEDKSLENTPEVSEKKNRKRWTWGRSRSFRTTDEPTSGSLKRRHSFFGSLRKRFSLRRAPVQSLEVPSTSGVMFTSPTREEESGQRLVEYKNGLKRKSIMRLTIPSPPPAETLEILVEVPRKKGNKGPIMIELETEKKENVKDRKCSRKSMDLWRIESSPDCGEKWIARSIPTPTTSQPKKTSIHQRSPLSECKSDGHLAKDNVYVMLNDGLGRDMRAREMIEEPGLKVSSPLNKHIPMAGVERFFSQLDEGMQHEEEVALNHRDTDDALEESLVIDSLNDIVYSETNDDLAKAIVRNVINRACAELAEENGQKITYLDKIVLNQCKRNISQLEERYLQMMLAHEEMLVTVKENASSGTEALDEITGNVKKQAYYKMMTEEYQGLNVESHALDNTNENNSNPGLNQEVKHFFDLSYEEKVGTYLSPEYTGPSVQYGIEGFATPSRRDDGDNEEFMALVDAFFGKAPSPLSPHDKRDIQDRLDGYIRFQDKRPSSDAPSSDAPVVKRSRLSIGEDDYVQDEGSFQDLPCSPDRNLSPMKFRRTQSLASDMKPAGSMFYGEMPQKDDSFSSVSFHAPPQRLKLEDKIAGSFLGGHSLPKYSGKKPVPRRKAGRSLDERPVGIHLGIARPVERQRVPCSPHLDDRPVGFHGQVLDVNCSRFAPRLWSSPKLEDRPVGVHFPSNPVFEPTDSLAHQLLQSPLPEDRPLGVHFGMTVESDVFHMPATDLDGSYRDESSISTPTLEKLQQPMSMIADISLGALSYYSLDESINFSSSSIIDQLP